MSARLRPYGRVLPYRFTRLCHLKAWVLGVGDGWRQPHDLSTSTNVDHLETADGMVQGSLDAGINAGQWLRSPLNHQRNEEVQ